MLQNLRAPEILLILVVLLLLFGAKRLPDLTRSVGRSMRIFKSEIKEMKDDDDARGGDPTAARPSSEEEIRRGRELEGRVVDPRDDGRAGDGRAEGERHVTEARHREP